VLSGQICYDQVQQQHVAAVYDARAALHSRVYQHPDSKAAELMIADALAVAEPLLQMQHQIQE
jgi:HD superfamily phosphohydrolase